MSQTIRKADVATKAAYGGLHPLYGSVVVDGVGCVIEQLDEGPRGVKYEVLAPGGSRFDEGVSSFCCTSLDDIHNRCADARLEPWPDDDEPEYGPPIGDRCVHCHEVGSHHPTCLSRPEAI